MTLVEWGKNVHQRLTDRFCRQRIVFHHVPKCGGTSVGRSLRRAYILSQGTVTPEESLAAYSAVSEKAGRKSSFGDVFELREMMLLYLMYSDVRCVSAHVPFSDIAFEKFQDRYQFVTLLRAPVDRFVSHYLWSHRRPGAHGHIKEEFEEFLDTDRAKAFGSTYARYFCGSPTFSQGNPVEHAVNNLRRMNHVGFLDDVKSFEGDLRRLTGKKLTIGYENVGKTRKTRNDIMDSRLRKKVLEICAPDIEIWDAVQDLRPNAPDAIGSHELNLRYHAGRDDPARKIAKVHHSVIEA
jgi:Sulfotransferase family